MTRQQSKVWLIGGGVMQEHMARTILETTAHDLLVSDGNPNCYLANIFKDNKRVTVLPLDTYDEKAHMGYIDNESLNTREIVGVLTDSADVGPTVSLIAERLGLIAASYAAASNARDKAAMRRLFDPHVRNHPLYMVLHKDDDATSVAKRWENRAKSLGAEPYPVVVKPADNCASRGLSITDSRGLAAALILARANLKRSNNILLEEYIHPRGEYATDWMILPTGAVMTNSCERYFDEFGMESGHVNPASVPEYVPFLVLRLAMSLGVTEGPFKVDFIEDENKQWHVIECATRWSGGFDHDYTGVAAKGYSPDKILLDYALGRRNEFHGYTDIATQRETLAAAYAPRVPGGTVVDHFMREKLLMQSGVVDVIVTRYGLGLERYNSCADRQLFIIAVDSHDPMRVAMNAWANYWGREV